MGERAPAPLHGIRVLELSTGIAGPYCTKLFADAGAEVWKVDPPGGDPLRRHTSAGPPAEGQTGALFRYLNAGKALLAPDGATIAELAAGADLVVEDGTVEVPGLSQVIAARPDLVVLSMSPFGRTGPLAGRPADELIVQAESGALMFKGRPDRPPVQAGGQISQFLGGVHGAVAALSAVLRARSGGSGELIDLALIDVMAVAGTNFAPIMQELMGDPDPAGPIRFVDTPGVEQAKDGYIAFNANTGQMFESFLLLIDRPDLIGESKWSNLRSRLGLLADWQEMVDSFVKRRSVSELMELAVELRVPVAHVHDGQTVRSDPLLRDRGVLVDGPDGLPVPRPPYLLDGVALQPRLVPPGTEGEEDHFHSSLHRVSPAAPESDLATLPLHGLRVLDLTSWWVGAAATQALALLGAEVIHIEATSHPDGMRYTGAFLADADWWEWGYMFLGANTNKRGITLDLSRPEGRRLLTLLLRESDILVENFTPRVADRFGLSDDAIRSVNSDLIFLRMPAYGLTGSWRDRPAFAQTIEPMTTMASVTGYPDDPPLAKGGLADAVAGAHGAWAALVGLARRRSTGRGVTVEAPMVEAALNVAAQPILESAAYGTVIGRTGNRATTAAPRGVYACRGEDQWLAISVSSDAEWKALREAMGDPEWARHQDLQTFEGRAQQHDLLDRMLGAWTEAFDRDDAVTRLASVGVPVGACWDPRLIGSHPQLLHRGLFEAVDHSFTGSYRAPGPPYRFGSVAKWLTHAAPTLGQHNNEVLGGLLGLTDIEILDLEAAGVIGSRPNGA